ncbi:MAG: ABC transporter permease subunit [Clostridium sp.]
MEKPKVLIHKTMRQTGILLFWLLLWQMASMAIQNNILFVGPADVLTALFRQVGTSDFWKTLGFSLSRICLGFLSAFFIAIFLAALAYRFSFFKELFTPIILLAKSVPVASFVILALIWMGSKNLSVFIAFVVVLPMIYAATLSGLYSTDSKLLEMAHIFRLTFFKKIKLLYLPALIPYLKSSVNTALGMSIKSGVAAEVIGVPDFSIGEKLYTAKIYLSTADLFAWTLVIILVSWLFEKLFLRLIELINPVKSSSAEVTS